LLEDSQLRQIFYGLVYQGALYFSEFKSSALETRLQIEHAPNETNHLVKVKYTVLHQEVIQLKRLAVLEVDDDAHHEV